MAGSVSFNASIDIHQLTDKDFYEIEHKPCILDYCDQTLPSIGGDSNYDDSDHDDDDNNLDDNFLE